MLAFFFTFAGSFAFDCYSDLCDPMLVIFIQIGDLDCNPSCMIEACNYDSYESRYASKTEMMKSSDCLFNCTLFSNCTFDLLKNNQCDQECNSQECGFDLGACGYCAENCFDNMLGNGHCDDACNNTECKFDLNDCQKCSPDCKNELINLTTFSNPCKIYVDYNATSIRKDGSKDFPYKTLAEALENPCDQFIEILLKPGFHVIEEEEFNINSTTILLIIRADNNDLSEYATLNITNSNFVFNLTSLYWIYFENIIFDRKDIVQDYVIQISSVLNTDVVCPMNDFNNFIYVSLFSWLYIANTTFQNMEYNLKSIIFSLDGVVRLYNTTFKNIKTYDCSDLHGVIILASILNVWSNTFIYENGLVELNNGFFSSLMYFASGFLLAINTGSVKISNITFVSSLSLCRGAASISDYCWNFISIEDCRGEFLLENCSFDTIFTGYMLSLDYSMNSINNSKWLDNNDEWTTVPKVRIANSTFNQIGSDTLVFCNLATNLLEIDIKDIYIINSIFETNVFLESSYYIYSDYMIVINVENVVIDYSLFSYAFTFSDEGIVNANLKDIYLNNINVKLKFSDIVFPYFNSRALSIYDNDEFAPLLLLSAENISSFTLSNFLVGSNLAPYSYQFCIVCIDTANHVSVRNASISSLYIDAIYAPINLLSCNEIFLDNIKITHLLNNIWAAGIALIDSSSATLHNIFIDHVYSSFQSGVYIRNCRDVTIENSTFSNTISLEIGGGVGINNLTHSFQVNGSKFIKNSDGAIGIFHHGISDVRFYIKNCEFWQNTNHQSGSAISYVSKYNSEFSNNYIITENCIFSGNLKVPVYIEINANYEDFGSVFTDNESMLVANGFSTQKNLFNGTKFYQNNLGNDLISISDGSLSCINCYFSENSIVLISLQSPAWVAIEDCVVFNNTINKSSLFFIVESIGIINFTNVSIINNQVLYNSIFTLQYVNFTSKYLLLKDNVLFSLNQPEIYLYNALFKAEDSLFISTKAKVESLISSSNCTLNFDNCEFRFINADQKGLIFLNYGKLYFSNSKMVCLESLDNRSTLKFISAQDHELIELRNSIFSNSFSIGVYLSNSKRIIVDNCSFLDGRDSICLSISNYDYLRISNSLFNNNTSKFSAAALEITNTNQTAVTKIEYSTFTNNKALNKAGAILLKCCNAHISNSTFENNSASEREGGAGYVVCIEEAFKNYFYGNSFKNNSARIGASLCIEGNNVEEFFNEYSDNSAKYGNETAFYPYGLAKYENNTLINDTALHYDGVCGLDYPLNFSFALFDINQKLVSAGFDGYSASLQPIYKNSTINGISATNPIEGVITFNNLTILCSPGSEVEMNLTYFGSIDFWYENPNTTITLNLTAILHTRDCINGEYRAENQCIYCKQGQYSLNPTHACNECPLNAYCYGGDLLVPKPGYWRGDINSTRIYNCLNPNACEGGLEASNKSLSLTGRCSEGYKGNLCQACDYGFSSSGGNKCGKCPSQQDNILWLLGLGVVTILVVAIVVYLTFITAHEPISISSIFFKILLNYFQVISIIVKLKLPWPWYADSWLSYQAYPGDVPSHLLSIDCLIIDKSDDESYKSIYFIKMIVIVCLPAALGIFIFIFWLIVAVIKNVNLSAVKNELITTLLILHFLILPTITNYMFSIYSCMSLYGELYLTSNLDIKCWDEKHLIYAFAVALPGILVWTIGIPLGVFLYLWKQKSRDSLYRLRTMLRFGFIYNGYRESKFYWEFVILIRKLLIIWISIFFTNDSIETQAIVCFTVLLIFFYLQYKCYPFEYIELNTAELISIFVELITIYCGLYYMTNELSLGGEIFFFILLLHSNAYFVLIWLKNVSKKMIFETLKKIQRLRIYLTSYKDYKKIEENSKKIANESHSDLEIKDKISFSFWAIRKNFQQLYKW